MTHSKKSLIAIAGVFILAAIFLMTATQPAIAPAEEPATTQAAATIAQPMPYENTNITWSSYNASMARNEFLNGTGAAGYINAEPSTFYQNYISLNPTDITSPKALQNNTLGTGDNWANVSDWRVQQAGSTNITYSLSSVTLNGQKAIMFSATVSGKYAGGYPYANITVPMADYPSQNIQYDYLTMIGQASVPTNSGALGVMMVNNNTGGVSWILGSANQPMYLTMSLSHIEKEYKTGFNTTIGQGFSSGAVAELQLGIPANAPDGTYSIILTGMAFTTYPITFGSNATGTTITNNVGNLQLSNFHPDVSNVSIVNGGYTEALSMPAAMAQNYTETQNQISSGNYIEETTTQAAFEFPTGADISYSATNITMPLNGIAGDQIPVFDLNGVSYTDTLSNKTGNETLYAGVVNPNEANNVIYQVEYTASQWNSITSPPFFLSVQGIEYYWWIGIIAIFGGLGIFAGLRSYATGKEENLRAPPKVR